MKKGLFICLIVLLCVLSFAACENEETTSARPEETTEGKPEETTEAHVHLFGEWSTTKEPTCTLNGEQERVCHCGEKEIQKVDALGHTDIVDAAVAPTCTDAGLTEGKHCSVCHEVIVAQETVAALGHTEVTDEAVAATCTQEGKTEGKHCSICNEILIDQITIKPTGKHLGQYVCSGCNTSYFNMTKELLIEQGPYNIKNDRVVYKILYNSSKNQIDIFRLEIDKYGNEYAFVIHLCDNNPSLDWEYSHTYQVTTLIDGQYISIGTDEEYMKGTIACSEVSTSMPTLNYTYTNFSTEYSYFGGLGYTSEANIEKINATAYFKVCIKTLNDFVTMYGKDKFTFYNLGFSNY